jgi:hypothetical protein
MYRLVSVSLVGDPSVDDVESARAALALGHELIAAGHRDIMVTTPDGRAFLFAEFVALMSPPKGL